MLNNFDNLSQELSNLPSIYNLSPATEEDTLPLPWTNRLDVHIFPNEYSNLFSFNRCLARLLENDIQLFKSTGNYTSITWYDSSTVYNKGDRIIVYNVECNDSTNLYKIYVCLKNKTKNIKPDNNTALAYYESLVIPPNNIPDNIYWAEDVINLDSFNTGTNGLTWNEYNAKSIKELKTFDLNNLNSNISTKTETYEGANLRRLTKPTENFSWPTNTPAIYSDFAVSNLLSSNPGILIYKNDDELITTSTEINGNDYIVSTVISSYTVSGLDGAVWYKLYKSGWVNQGGIQPVIINSTTSSNVIQGKDTYIIGISPKANICIKNDINMLLPIDILSFNFSAGEISANIPPNSVSCRIYNKQVIFNDVNNTITNPTAYIAGLVTKIGENDKETIIDDLFTNDTINIKYCITWESTGISANTN